MVGNFNYVMFKPPKNLDKTQYVQATIHKKYFKTNDIIHIDQFMFRIRINSSLDSALSHSHDVVNTTKVQYLQKSCILIEHVFTEICRMGRRTWRARSL